MSRAFLAAPLVALALTGCAPLPAETTDDPNTIDMRELVFDTDAHQIPVGGRITFSNASSRSLHVLVAGDEAQPRSQPGAPSFGGASGHRAEVGDRWTTPPWNVAGTYQLTCTLHPRMNLQVVVGGT